MSAAAVLVVLLLVVLGVYAVGRGRGGLTSEPLGKSSAERLPPAEEVQSQNGSSATATSAASAPATLGDLFPWLPDSVAFVDVETTGLDADRHQIIEIAVLVVDRSMVLDGDGLAVTTSSKSSLIKPLPGCRISARITEITGLDRAKLLAEGRDHAEVLPELLDIIGTRPVVAHHAPFDVAFLRAAAARHGRPFTNEFLCTLEMTRLAFPGLPSYKLESLAEVFKLPHRQAHRAASDIEAMAPLFFTTGRRLHELGITYRARQP